MRSPSRLLLTAAAVAADILALSIIGPGVRAAGADQALVDKGAYLVKMGDCMACHTAPGGKAFAGGLAMKTPFGTIYTPNITPDKATGIGNWSDDDFYRAMHEGIDDHGKYLYPVFPFPWYTKVTRDDVLAIKSYLLSVTPVDAPRKPLEFGFPFNIRESLLTWRTAFFKPNTFAPDPTKSDEINRGAYLVEGLGHCGECHNKSKLTGVTDLSGRLEGGEINGWYAPNITSDGQQGIGSWSTDDLVTYLHTGSAPGRGVVLGPMQEVIHDSLSQVSEADVKAIATYLESVPAKQTDKPVASDEAQVVAERGAGDYLNNCASCHGVTGQGLKDVIPALAGNGAVTAAGPENIIRVAVGGLLAREGHAPMPAAGAALTDQQVADIANYVRTAWGNKAPANAAPDLVAKARAQAQTVMAATKPDQCTPAGEAPYVAQGVNQAQLRDELKGATQPDMLQKIDEILPKVRAMDPQASDDKLLNAMIEAYCPLAVSDSSVPATQRATLLGNFATLAYGRLRDIRTGSKD